MWRRARRRCRARASALRDRDARPRRAGAPARAGVHGLVVVVLAGDRVLELAHALAERAAHLGQALRPEDEQHDDEAGSGPPRRRFRTAWPQRTTVFPNVRLGEAGWVKKPLAEQVIVVSGALERDRAGRRAGRRRARRQGRRLRPQRRGAATHAVAEIEAAGGRGARRSGRRDERGRRREPLRAGGRALRPDRHLRRHGDGDRLRRGRAARAGRAAPRPRRQLPRSRASPTAPRCRTSRRAAARSSTSTRALAYRGDPAPGRLLRLQGGGARLLRVGARRARARGRRRRRSRLVLPGAINTPQFDRGRQKLGLQPQPVPPIYQPEVVADGRPPLLRAPAARAAGHLGGAEAPLGAEALAPRRRPASCSATAGRARRPASRSRSTPPTTSGRRFPGDPGAHGRFDAEARASSAWTWRPATPG